MTTLNQIPGPVAAERATGWLPGPWWWLAVAAALLGAAGSLVGLALPDAVYGRETEILADAAAAQDLVNLVIVAPLVVVLGRLARRGRLDAYLGWLGCLAFTVYNYAIYAFSIHFGPLFLVWVAVLGLSTFALVGSVGTADTAAIRARFAGSLPRWPAGFLVVAASLFVLLWLREIVPDLIAGGPSRSAAQWNVPTSPVHVLDLAFFLPAAVGCGAAAVRGHRLAAATVLGWLTWVALTCLPILVNPLVAAARGHQATWAVTVPVGVLLLATAVALGRLRRAIPQPPGPS